MPRKNPLGKIKDTTLGTLRDPKGTAEKAVGQARGTVALGRMVADQVTRSASGAVISRLPGRKPAPPRTKAPEKAPEKAPAEAAPPRPSAAQPAAKQAPAKQAPAKKAAATPATGS